MTLGSGFETITRRGAFSVVEKLHPKRIAFTLAEVLIVLGIIGLVADMTIPTLMGSYRKQIAVVRLQKFYSSFDQAVKLSEIDNGPMEDWGFPTVAHDAATSEIWFKKYFAPYVRVLRIKCEGGYLFVDFADGSRMIFEYAGGDLIHIHFYPFASQKNKMGTNDFVFLYSYYPKYRGVQPYWHGWNGTRETLLSHSSYGCGSGPSSYYYCTRLIMYDGWKISDDYPFKF